METINEINPVCERCGKCCDSYTFWMTNRMFDNDPLEIKRLATYHGIKVVANAKGQMGIVIPLTCEHLAWENGKSVCKINDTKPVVCRQYFCGKTIEKALGKIADGVHI